jgi:hypothetical protein
MKYRTLETTQKTGGKHSDSRKSGKNNGNESNMFKTKRVLSESWAEPSTSWQKMKTKSTKRTIKTKKTGGRGKNPRQDRQYTYEQARSTRHAGRPSDYFYEDNLYIFL